ncbi:MAG: DinB family protein [Gemmatimonadetes bacterium]|nr:DinB family protein [Gemmatimonadota bacterium]
MKTLSLLLAILTPLAAEQLTQGERDRAMSHLHVTRKMFLDSIAGLSEAQWNFKPSPERWSVAECAEHIAVSEDMLFQLVTEKIVKSPAVPGKKSPAEDEAVSKGVADRTNKFQAPEFLRPKSRWPTQDALISHFKQSRDKTIAYAQTTTDELRSHFAPHPVLKELDAYQWLLLLSGHSERHTLQILEVKADPNFPN